MGKVICPNCGSEDLEYFMEFTYTKYYKLDENNRPTNKVLRASDNHRNDEVICHNYICQDCGEIFGGTSPIKAKYKEE